MHLLFTIVDKLLMRFLWSVHRLAESLLGCALLNVWFEDIGEGLSPNDGDQFGSAVTI